MASSPVTRASLITRVAQRANTSGYADVSLNGEVSVLVDLALAKFHNFLVGLYEDFYTKTVGVPIVANQDTYNLPGDFMKERQVFYTDASGYRWPLRRIDIYELTNLPLSVNYASIPTGYSLYNNSLVIFPKPSSTQNNGNSMLLFYIPNYTPPLNDATPIEYQVAFGWDEWVVNDCVIQIRNKAMMPAQELVQERDNIEKHIRHQAKQRNAGDPPRFSDRGWNGSTPMNRWGQFAIK
jgi:hypothetical protein